MKPPTTQGHQAEQDTLTGGDQLAEARAAAEDIVSNTQSVLDRALSQDTEAFLHSARQRSAE